MSPSININEAKESLRLALQNIHELMQILDDISLEYYDMPPLVFLEDGPPLIFNNNAEYSPILNLQ
jgi:hypothetical protein